MQIKVNNYEHFNRSMGKYITSKRHYQEEMARGGYLPDDKATAIKEKAIRDRQREYKLSKTAQQVIESVKNHADRNGNIKMSDRLIEGMKKVGVKI